MPENDAFMKQVSADVLVDKQLSAHEKPDEATIDPDEGDTLFMEDYVPFGMGEICGNFDGFDGDDAVCGLQVDKELTVNEMERKYAADGLYL